MIEIRSIGLSVGGHQSPALSCKLTNFSESQVFAVHLIPLRSLLVLKCYELELMAKFIEQAQFSRQ